MMMSPERYEVYKREVTTLLTSMSKKLNEDTRNLINNVKFNADNTQFEFSIGEYSFFVEGRVFLTSQENPIIIRTFERIIQTERTLPKGELIIKAIPEMDIIYRPDETPLFKKSGMAAVHAAYMNRLEEYIARIEKEVYETGNGN